MGISIDIADSDESIRSAFSVMNHLRDLDDLESFLKRVRNQEQGGYRLVTLAMDGQVVAVAGFRIGQSLAWGKYLYVDDLVSVPDRRSTGLGGMLLEWLKQHGREAGCDQLHLDSGLARRDAHRFYEREGLAPGSLHFSCAID